MSGFSVDFVDSIFLMNFFPFRKHIFPFTYYCFWKHVLGGWGCVFNWLARLICDNHGPTLNDNLIYYRGDSIIARDLGYGFDVGFVVVVDRMAEQTKRSSVKLGTACLAIGACIELW